MKKLILPLLLVLFVTGFASAQRTVSGTLTNDDGEPLIGASVLVKGTTVGTVADFDGTYTLDVPDGSNTLVFSFTGYQQQEIEIGTSNVIDLVLSEGVELGEVVVTGLGIKREKKALGYGVSTITSGDIAGRQEADVARILRGKATGVDITQTSGLAGSGTNVIIRGYSSITGDNQPLFIVDGIPFNTETSSNSGFGQGGAAASSRFLDLDPNAIEEVSILKGLSATVLYGEAGRNGVILITTKNGSGASANKGLEISVNQSLSFSEVANLPDYQNTFGNGFNAGFGWFFSNWGAAFEDLKPSSYGSDYKGEKNGQVIITHPYDQGQYHPHVPQFKDAEYIYQPHESVEKFLEKPGVTTNTSVSIQSNLGSNSSVSATYSYLNDEGFTPDLDEERGGGASNFLKKHNFGLGASTKLQNGLDIKGSFNFVASDRLTPITSTAFGGAGNGLFAAVLFTPRSMDLMGLPYQSPLDGSSIYYRRGSRGIQNPRWILNNASDADNTLRFFSTVQLGYEINDNIRLMYRLGLDQYSLKQTRVQNRGGAINPDGLKSTSNRLNRISDQLINLMYQFELSPDLSLDGIVGFNVRRQVQEGFIDVATNQFVYGLHTNQNFIDHQSFSGSAEENTLGAYATATLGYKNYAYLNLQARNDWTSTLEEENRRVFYPSVSLSFVPTDAIPSLQNSTVLNYLKVRLGYGTSAGYPNPYQTRNTLSTYTNGFVTAGGTILNGNNVSGRLGNGNLMRELHKEIEGGIEARFLRNRIGVDLSLYNRNSSDLIINLNLDPATGFKQHHCECSGIGEQGN